MPCSSLFPLPQVLTAEDAQLEWLPAERLAPLLEAVQRKCASVPMLTEHGTIPLARIHTLALLRCDAVASKTIDHAPSHSMRHCLDGTQVPALFVGEASLTSLQHLTALRGIFCRAQQPCLMCSLPAM